MAENGFDGAESFDFEESVDDAEFDPVDRAELKVVKHKKHTDLRRKIEDRLERRRISDDLGIYDLDDLWSDKAG